MKFESYCNLDINIFASIIIIMRVFFLIMIVLIVGCAPSSQAEWSLEGVCKVRDLIEELEKIKDVKDLYFKRHKLKKTYNKLVEIMIAADSYEKEDFILGKKNFYNDTLRKQYLRIYEMEGGREMLIKIQKESLHKLDRYVLKKH